MGQKRWFSPGMPIALEAGDAASLTIRMLRFGAITGTLLDENDVGLLEHEVAVYTNARPPKLLARATTDDRGMYRLFNLFRAPTWFAVWLKRTTTRPICRPSIAIRCPSTRPARWR
ncbi:MAG: hypothetical protein WDO73_14445 [Ignavibacteriota bacterium]